MEKKYDVPRELQGLMSEAIAMAKLRDALVKQPFRFKKAKECAIKHEQLRSKFWQEIRLLYPELRGEICYQNGEYVTLTPAGTTQE